MKKEIKTYLILLIYAICLSYLWGECFRGFETSTVTCGIGFTLTFISTFFIQKQFNFKLNIWHKLFFISLMIAYSLIFLIGEDFRSIIFSPYFLLNLFLIFSFFVFIDLRKFHNNIFFVLLTITYTNNYFSNYKSFFWGNENERNIIIDGSETSNTTRQIAPKDLIDISTFLFLDLNSDTIKIKPNKPFLFIETWNETCYPCKRAIRELTPMLDTIDNIESFFIYENKKFNKDIFISSSKKVKELTNQNVLADYNQHFYKSMNMVAYPTFLIIDNNIGKIEYMSIGYGGKITEEKWKNKLIEISKK